MNKNVTVPYDESFFRARDKVAWIEENQVSFLWRGSRELITRKSKTLPAPIDKDALEMWLGRALPDVVALTMFAVKSEYKEGKFMIVVNPVRRKGGMQLVANAHAYKEITLDEVRDAKVSGQ